MKLIDADIIHEELNLHPSNFLYNEMRKLINRQPTVDAVPTRYGKWIEVGSLSCRCDQCGCKNNRESNYCPQCGAKMGVQ